MKKTKDKYFKKKRIEKVIACILAFSLMLMSGESMKLKASDEAQTYHMESRVVMGRHIGEASILRVTDQVYTGNSITPSVTVKDGSVTLKKGTDYLVYYSNNKSIGKATITIAGVGIYKGSTTVNFNILPKKPAQKTPVSKTGSKIGVSWEKSPGAAAYEVSYATSSNGTYKVAGTTKELSYTIEKLTSGKTYYVRVRAYKTVDSKKYYSAYSAVRSVKVN